MAAPIRRDPAAQQTLGAGGPTPGEWVFPTCAGPGVIDPMPPVWVTGAQPAAAVVQVDPVVLAEQAVKQLGFALADDRDGPASGEPAAGGGGDVAVDRPGRLADAHRVGNGGAGHDDGHGDAVEGGVGHGRRRHRHL